MVATPMSIEPQESRVCEAPKAGWVIWLSQEAFDLVQELLESVVHDPERKMEDKKRAEDILEGVY